MDDLHQKITNRLHRMEGQVRGIEGMLKERKNYAQIIQQLEALRSASNNIISLLIEEKFCQTKKYSSEDVEYLRRFIRRQ